MKLSIFHRSLQVSTKLALLAALCVSCTKDQKKNSLNGLLTDSEIVSTRPQNTKQFLAILKLTQSALLESGQKQNGKVLIDQRQLKSIATEQDEAITALKNLSSDIQVLYRYRMVLNGLAVLAPIEVADKLKTVGSIVYSEGAGNFAQPKTMELSNSVSSPSFTERNSSKFIGAEKLNLAGITGRGVKVGIIDTGIDYTHAMFKGVGTADAYKAVNPAEAAVGFPNDKVVGGIDLVGTEFDSASPEFSKHIPRPDMNPLDEAGHGTHVAGTVAGLGDGVNTYNGMAPEASLYAIKVFGAEGSTSDAVVIAALEYAADPNHDGDNSDQLDVVNMSLGSGYGNPHILYSESIKNLVQGGTVVVASAGNSGHLDYIVGAPSTADLALSVAASVDNADQNWKFNTSKIRLGQTDQSEILLVEAIEAATSKKIAEAPVVGPLVYIGTAAAELTDEQKAAVHGKVALIDRGQVTFNDKLKRAAAAGAIGVVVANNVSGTPLAMGTSDSFDFPAIMITLEDGQKIKEALKNSDTAAGVTIEFQAAEKKEKPELVDTLTSFTSKGPRSVDGFIKPEIAAPGNNVISAKMGGGAAAVQMSGTSMAGPHMAGVMALLRQSHPDLSAEELKSLAMGTAKTIGEKGQRYPISLQGSGRVQADKAAESAIVIEEPSLSLGETAMDTKKTFRRLLHVKNISANDLTFNFNFDGNGFIKMAAVPAVTVKAGATAEVAVSLTLDTTQMKDENIREMDGWIKLSLSADAQAQEIYRVPVLAIAHRLSAITASDFVVQSTSELDSDGAAAQFKLQNLNGNSGEVQLFNLIGLDQRKPFAESYMSSDCDLQMAGYRIVTKMNEKNLPEDFLQIAIKTFKPMTTWNTCDVSVMIDSNQDGVFEQELLGASLKSIPGQKTEDFETTLLDATQARAIRQQYESEVEKYKNDPVKLADLKNQENYDKAVIDQQAMKIYNNSTVVILEAAVKSLAKTAAGNLDFKILVTHNDQGAIEMDDYLDSTVKADAQISLKKEDQAYLDLPVDLKLNGNEAQTVSLTKGTGHSDLMVLLPQNKFSTSSLVDDSQAMLLKATYKNQ